MTRESDILLSDAYKDFLSELKERIRSAQIRAALAVNQELIHLYWQIGNDILGVCVVAEQKTTLSTFDLCTN